VQVRFGTIASAFRIRTEAIQYNQFPTHVQDMTWPGSSITKWADDGHSVIVQK